MALREAVTTEPLDLLEDPLRHLRRVAAADHAADQTVAINADTLGVFEGRHGAAQRVRLELEMELTRFRGHPEA